MLATDFRQGFVSHRSTTAYRVFYSAVAFCAMALFVCLVAGAPQQSWASSADDAVTFTVVKTDPSAQTRLEGSLLHLAGDSESAVDGIGVVDFTSSANPDTAEYGFIEGLFVPGGFIYLTETAPAPGYAISPLSLSYPDAQLTDDGALKMTIGTDEQLYYANTAGGLSAIDGNLAVVRGAPTFAGISLVDAATGAALPAGSFTVTGDMEPAFAGDDNATQMDMPSNGTDGLSGQLISVYNEAEYTYTVHQASAPAGYAPIDGFSFTVDEYGTLHLTDASRADVQVSATQPGMLVVQQTAVAAGGAETPADETAVVVPDGDGAAATSPAAVPERTAYARETADPPRVATTVAATGDSLPVATIAAVCACALSTAAFAARR